MTNNKVIYALAGLFGLIFYLYAVSLMYCLLAKIPLEAASPFFIFSVFASPITDQIQSRLFVAFGAPAVALIFVGGQLYETLFNDKDQFG